MEDIKGYEGIYKIDINGNIYSSKRNLFLKHQIITGGYSAISLCKNGKKKRYLIHRLIAIYFIKNPHNLSIVDHIDNNVKNNKVENLRWCDVRMNSWNSKPVKIKKYSKYKGVSYDKKKGKFIAKIREHGRQYCIGAFIDDIEAARAYDKKAIKIFKEFARINNV